MADDYDTEQDTQPSTDLAFAQNADDKNTEQDVQPFAGLRSIQNTDSHETQRASQPSAGLTLAQKATMMTRAPIAKEQPPDPDPPPIEEWKEKLMGKRMTREDEVGGENVSHLLCKASFAAASSLRDRLGDPNRSQSLSCKAK